MNQGMSWGGSSQTGAAKLGAPNSSTLPEVILAALRYWNEGAKRWYPEPDSSTQNLTLTHHAQPATHKSAE